ncbi:YdcH family protein [Donghicola eburneus]|uniref:YdcH family protein n=1 Tax=Donghicola eburneus TaxID=393278 RepID=UPI0008F207CA|nr:YdcH family protein [Donghicola eburneus]SFQ73762.1 hypothetical protein SAMN05421764_1145 [Donghicola eburneus]
MKNDVRLKVFSLEARLAKLRSKHGTLKALIARELKRPVPCSVTLQTLKRQRLRIKDEMVRCVSRLQGARSSGRLQEWSV